MLHQAADVVVSAGFKRMTLIDAKAYAHTIQSPLLDMRSHSNRSAVGIAHGSGSDGQLTVPDSTGFESVKIKLLPMTKVGWVGCSERCSLKIVARVIEPAILDMQWECIEEVRAKWRGQTRWCEFAVIELGLSSLEGVIVPVADRVRKIWR